MMYSEFVAGTGCKDNDHNYKVFRDLEVMYMNSNLSKQDIYEYGKKLVDNSKSEEQLKFEAEIKAEIKEAKEQIESNRMWAEHYKLFGNTELVRYYRNQNRELRAKIASLKWVLE